MENNEKMNFETAYSELEKLVVELENGSQDLETMLAKYEEGRKLADHCRKQLDEAVLTVKTLQTKAQE